MDNTGDTTTHKALRVVLNEKTNEAIKQMQKDCEELASLKKQLPILALGLRSSCLEGVLLADARLGHGLYRRWGIKTAREYARIKIDGLRLVGGNPDFTNPPGHGDDDARFYDRQQAYVHARGG